MRYFEKSQEFFRKKLKKFRRRNFEYIFHASDGVHDGAYPSWENLPFEAVPGTVPGTVKGGTSKVRSAQAEINKRVG